MNSYTIPTRQRRRFQILLSLMIIAALLLSGCHQPSTGEGDDFSDLAIPAPKWPGLEDMQRYLELPDLSQIPGMPALSDLPFLHVPEGGIAFAGPVERRVAVGEQIPGTDMTLLAINEDGAEFRIEAWQTARQVGDSLDFDGAWPGLEDTAYALRLRIYHIAGDHIRVAGVHRLVIEHIKPTVGTAAGDAVALKFAFADSVAAGEQIPGSTYGYQERGQRGAWISGLPNQDYPYRKLGDSVVWEGAVRADIPARYDLRVLYYNDNQIQIAGIITLLLPLGSPSF